MHVFDTPGKTRLRVKNAAGLISVDPSETGRTTVELEPLRDDDATREAIERATVEMNGNEISIEIGVGGKGFGVGPAWITFGRTPQVGIRIRCPEDTDLDCATASADVMTSGRLGNVELKTASGDITVEHVAGLRVQSASGDVRGVTADGEARIQTVSGDVRLGTVTGPVTATLVSGDFAIDDCPDGPLRQDGLRRSAHRRDPGRADQRPVGLGRRPHRRPPRDAPPDRRQLDERRRQLRARCQGRAVRGIHSNRGAAGGEDRQRRHRDHPGRSRLCLR